MKTCLIRIIILAVVMQVSLAGKHQKRLIEKLFKNYDPTERPVANDSENLLVLVGLSIQQIVDIDEKKQIITFSGWLDMTWTDYNLKWNPAEFGNISVISAMSSKVWVPDLLLYNSADDSFDPKAAVNVVINSNGEINYLPPGMFRSTCLIEIYEFPFDEQQCGLKFGSWTYDDSTVDLKNKSHSAQMDSYVANGEWSMESVISYSESKKYECCPTQYPFVMFVMHLRRRTLYFIFNFVFPCVLISFMTILGFILPPDSGEKIGLEMTTLLSIIMFSQLITGIIPESSLSVPKISVYFGAVIIICTISIVANVLVLILHHRNVKLQQPMPKWIKKWICGYVARLLMMRYPAKPEADNQKSGKNFMCHDLNEASSKSLLANVLDLNDDYFNKGSSKFKSRVLNEQLMSGLSTNRSTLNRQSSALSDHFDETDPNPIKRNLAQILKELKTLTRKIKDDEDDEEKELYWKFAAMVMDRLCMLFFAAATFFSTTLILLTSKNFFKLI